MYFVCESIIMQLDECNPKPAKPLEYIVEKIGFQTIGIDEFIALKEDFNRLRDEVLSMRKELTKLKMQSIDAVNDIENNNMPSNQSTTNDHIQSMGLVFGDICFEKFTNGIESYNVFAKVDNCLLTNENANVVSANKADLATFCPEKRIDCLDNQSINDISLDQSKTTANDCSHSTEVEEEVNVSACQSDGSAYPSDGSENEISNTDEMSDIQALEMIPEEHETDENASATESSNEIIPSENLQTIPEVSVELNGESDEQNLQSNITDISFDQSKTSACDCPHSTDLEAEMNISADESIESGCANETTIAELSYVQVLGVIQEENETGEKISSTLSSNDTIPNETGQSAATDLNISEQSSQNITVISSDLSEMIDSEILPNKSKENSDKVEAQENSIEIGSVDKSNVSKTTENIQKIIHDCFIQNCNEMQAAKLPPSDSEDSEVKMSNTTQSDEMVTCNVHQQLPNDTVREMTDLNISVSAERFEINKTMGPIQSDSALIIMDGVGIANNEIELIDNQIKMNIKSMSQDSCQSSTSSSGSSSDVRTIVKHNAQNKLNEDNLDGISGHDKKVPNGIEKIKARQFPRDDIETEFLLSISSTAERSIQTVPSK